MHAFKIVKKNPKAVIPTKAHQMDVGYDLTVIGVYKKISDTVTLFDTGLAMSPPSGYYTEILPRSSISKSGYMLSNSVGVIDPNYTGNFLVSLTKIDRNMPDLEPPFKICQMIVRKVENDINFIEVDSLEEQKDSRETKARGAGGFGSSDVK